jgi:hypothetical protein
MLPLPPEGQAPPVAEHPTFGAVEQHLPTGFSLVVAVAAAPTITAVMADGPTAVGAESLAAVRRPLEVSPGRPARGTANSGWAGLLAHLAEAEAEAATTAVRVAV